MPWPCPTPPWPFPTPPRPCPTPPWPFPTPPRPCPTPPRPCPTPPWPCPTPPRPCPTPPWPFPTPQTIGQSTDADIATARPALPPAFLSGCRRSCSQSDLLAAPDVSHGGGSVLP